MGPFHARLLWLQYYRELRDPLPSTHWQDCSSALLRLSKSSVQMEVDKEMFRSHEMVALYSLPLRSFLRTHDLCTCEYQQCKLLSHIGLVSFLCGYLSLCYFYSSDGFAYHFHEQADVCDSLSTL